VNDLPTLKTALLDLLYETHDTDLKLIVGGGYGIFLKRQHAQESGTRTVLTAWPEARSTNDIDLFLRPELLICPDPLMPLGPALDRLGYKVIPGAEKFQFARPGPTGGLNGSLKIDLLTGPRSRFVGTRAKVDSRRVSPKPSVGVHAHHVDEALTLEEGLLPIRLAGQTTAGPDHAAEVYLPHPLTFAMMKLFAFRDWASGEKGRDDDAKKYGRYHALDLYTVIATASESEWDHGLELRDRYRGEAEMAEAARIVKDQFANATSLGMIRMRENGYYREDLQATEFLNALHELFGG
jgi:hypothetical protein